MKKHNLPLARKSLVILLVVLCLTMCACDMQTMNANYTPVEQPHLYWKDIDVVVQNVDQRSWFATVHRYELNITVYSEEYGLEKTLHYSGSGMINSIPGWNAKEGDILSAQLYSWVMDSTGEIVKRDINKIY